MDQSTSPISLHVRTSWEYLAGKVHTLPGVLRQLCATVLLDTRFCSGYGAAIDGTHGHHAFKGGLLVHTAEVLEIALATASSSNLNLDSRVLITAAVFHDYCKIYDYDEQGRKTKYRNLIRHLSGSHAFFVKCADAEQLTDDFKHHIEYCILAHHGRQEWGSPILPQTAEAHVLHQADYLSMLFGPAKNFRDKDA